MSPETRLAIQAYWDAQKANARAEGANAALNMAVKRVPAHEMEKYVLETEKIDENRS